MSVITQIYAREILDSRGNPTVEAEVHLSTQQVARASVPAGASTGKREAVELRDGGRRYGGKGVTKAVEIIHRHIAPAFKNQSVVGRQTELDQMLRELAAAANVTLPVSLAIARAESLLRGVPLHQSIRQQADTLLPTPLMNIINGGAHADNNLDIQEFMIVPLGAPSFSEALRYGVEVFHTLKKLLTQQGLSTAVGDEGGFAPNLRANQAALDMIMQAIEQAGFKPGVDIALAMDLASSEFYRDGRYTLASENRQLTADALTELLANWVRTYPIISIEDAMAEDDWAGWQLLTEKLGKTVQLVGDDLFVTNTALLSRGISENIANSILIKPNQIGTLTQTLSAIDCARAAGYTTVISHRSGETEDTFIADLAVATSAGQIKTGSLCRTDRVAKYNQLLRIEDYAGDAAKYAGNSVFSTRWTTLSKK